MRTNISETMVDDAIKLIFEQRIGLGDTCKILGIRTPNALSKKICARGLTLPYIKKNVKQLPDNEIVSLYESGLSELELSKKFNVGRPTIRKRLVDAGVEIRGQSQANIVSMARMTPEQRKDRAKKANDTIRGARQSKESCLKRSAYAERFPENAHIGFGEKEFKEILEERSIDFVWQKSCDVYSIDFAIGNIAVELKHGRTGTSRADQQRNRIKNLRKFGFACFYIIFDTIDALIANIDKVISELEAFRRNPTPVGKYRVIRCTFNRFTRSRDEFGRFTAIETTPQPFTISRTYNE